MKKFNLYFAVLAVIGDALGIIAGLILAYVLRADGEDLYFWPFDTYVVFVLKFLPIWLVIFAVQGLYNVRHLPRGWNAVGRLLIGLFSGWGVMLIALYLSRSPAALVFPRLIIVYGFLLTLLFTVSGRIILTLLRQSLNNLGHGLLKTAVVVKNNGERFIAELRRPIHGRNVVEVIEDDYLNRLDEVRRTQGLEEVIVADPNMDERMMLQIINWAEDNHCNFAQVPSLLSVRATNVEASTLAGTPVLHFRRTPLEGWGRIYKRLLDAVLVSIALIILSPVFLLVYLAIKISSRGPAIFKQRRIGQDGKTFYVHKFRSMYADADERFKEFGGWSADEKNDPRVTPLGRFLRRTDLDELPQLFDVLIGSMSLVGPRPEQPQYVEKFSKEVPDYLKRHHVKSGLTGWAQVNGLRGDTSISERVKYDLYYIENWSIWFDLRIILATFIHIVRKALKG